MTYKTTTVDKTKWIDFLKENPNIPNTFSDIDIITSEWFVNNVNVAGYMTSPTAICDFNGAQYAIFAKSRKVTNFREFLDYVKERKDQIFVYQIIFVPSSPTCYTIDENTFEPKQLECPMINEGYWKVRFGEVELTDHSIYQGEI